MKNYTLKQKLKAKQIINLEINSFAYPENYKQVIENLNKYNSIGDLKISEALQILEYCENHYDVEGIYSIFQIFAHNEEEVKQIQTDLNYYIKAFMKYIEELEKRTQELMTKENQFICGSCGEYCKEYTYNKATDTDECKRCKEYNKPTKTL